jgi:hypothetical protein
MLLLAVLVLVLGYGIYLGMRKPGGIYGFDFLAATVLAGFFLPQLIGLRGSYGLPPGAWAFTTFMTILTAIMCYAGFRMPVMPSRVSEMVFSEKRLLIVASFFTGVGGIAYFLLGSMSETELARTQWSGMTVAYLFFAKLSVFGLAISAIYFFRTRQAIWGLLMAVPLVIYAYRMIFLARRGDTVEIVMVLLLALWFTQRRAVPRFLFLIGVIAASVLLPSTGAYRSAMSPYAENQQSLEAKVNTRSIEQNFKVLLTQGGQELRNAITYTWWIGKYDTPNFGLSYYNELVRLYFPAQVFGAEAKQRLLIDLGHPGQRFMNFRAATGSTLTGLVDSYASFRIFGVLVFGLIAWNLRHFYVWAERGSITHQVLYMTLINDGLQAMTHSTSWYLGTLVYTAIFLLPVLALVRERRPQHLAGPSPAPAAPPVYRPAY